MSEDFSKAFDNLRTCVDGVACWSGISSWCKEQRNCTKCESNVNSHMEVLYDAHNHDMTEHRDASAKLTILQRALSRDYGIDVKWDSLRHTWTIETDTTRHKDELRSEYHRGYVDAMHARATATWQLDRERLQVVARLRDCRATETAWVEAAFERIGGAILGENGFIVNHYEDIEKLIECLIHLLGGSNLQESPNPINKDAETESYLIESADFNKLDDRERVVRKLQVLRFDGGSHENLSKIAYAIYPCATGWTCESAKGLRDSLVRLIGGDDADVHMDGRNHTLHQRVIIARGDGSEQRAANDHCHSGDGRMGHSVGVGGDDGGHCVSGDVCRRACADGGAGDSGEQTEVSDGRVADDSGCDTGGGYSGVPIHMDGLTTYDVLGNERQKAVCELRELSERGNVWGRELIVALGLPVNATNDDMCDRLIHLLGGDQPSGIDVLRAMDADGTSPNDDGICPNDDQILSITNELREWASTEVPYKYGRQLHAIADSIDEQVKQLKHDEEMWRDRAEDMRMERDDAEHERDRYKAACEAAQSLNRDMMDGISQLRSSLSSVLDALDGGDAR